MNIISNLADLNILHIPSWFPNTTNPINGIFTKEQIWALAKHYPEHNFLVNLWGQQDTRYMLWWNQPFKNFKKVKQYSTSLISQQLYPNLWTAQKPTFTWTRKILEGNLQGIVKANEQLYNFYCRQGLSPDIIHAHVAYPAGEVARRLSEKHDIPYVLTEQMSPFPLTSFGKKGTTWRHIRNAIEGASGIISISTASSQEITNLVSCEPVIIPNTANEQIFKPKQVTLPESPFRFFCLGRMEPQKGIPDLLNAIHLLADKEKYSFRIGGGGSLLTEYQKLAAQLKIEDHILWLGELTRSEAAKEFAHCHAFVLPSLHESMGVVYIEALAMGKPIIATRNGGAESIVNEKNGLLTDINNPEQLAKAMDQIMNNYSYYNSEEIRKDFELRFSCDTTLPKIMDVYLSVKKAYIKKVKEKVIY